MGAGISEPRLVEVRRNVLKQNDVIARALREQFRAAGVFVIRLASSPGAGKTTFLEKTLTRLQPRYRVAALVGELATENDAVRLARSNAPVQQHYYGHSLPPGGSDGAERIAGRDLRAFDFLFIENVGNLVCPSSYDLGENLRLVLMSVTEGEDKPLKYPTIFNIDWDTARMSIQSVRPGMQTFRLSAKTGDGMEEYLSFLAQQLAGQKTMAHL